MPHAKFLKALLLTVAVSAFAAAPASAVNNLFLQDSNFIADLNLPTYAAQGTGTIAISSMSFGATAASSWLKGAGATVGKAVPDEVTITKAVDANTSYVMSKMIMGQNIGQVKIRTYMNTGASQPQNNLTYCFNEAFVTSSKQTVGEDGRTQETVSFAFKKMALGTASQQTSGKLNPFTRCGWDVTTNITSTLSATTECVA